MSLRGNDGVSRGMDRLTPQQVQIPRLAATGLINQRIGERLLVSVRTIGFHLDHRYPRLGFTSGLGSAARRLGASS
ncbi:LuxR C-terminal-related transcriptional regulator [Streptomyces rubrogriseus]|uniref:HTH luxR-type domain-containing protein n=1 Tax=Streptomyces rubrogriseus TaxID=194673 RepID=A0A6G3T8P4_9ACTN|nr:hypothetical protein [Streptomyces rubrogriseus]